MASGWSDCGPTEVGKCGVMGQMAGKPHHFSALLPYLFKVQGLSLLRQRIEACLQMVVEHNPWFPEEGSFNLEIWNRVKKKKKKKLNEPQDGEKISQ